MRSALFFLTLTLAGPSDAAAAARPNAAAKPTVEVLLDKLSATKNKIGALTAAATVTPKKTILIEDEDGLIMVASGGVRRVPGVGGLDAFDYTPDGVFLGTQGRDLLPRRHHARERRRPALVRRRTDHLRPESPPADPHARAPFLIARPGRVGTPSS